MDDIWRPACVHMSARSQHTLAGEATSRPAPLSAARPGLVGACLRPGRGGRGGGDAGAARLAGRRQVAPAKLRLAQAAAHGGEVEYAAGQPLGAHFRGALHVQYGAQQYRRLLRSHKALPHQRAEARHVGSAHRTADVERLWSALLLAAGTAWVAISAGAIHEREQGPLESHLTSKACPVQAWPGALPALQHAGLTDVGRRVHCSIEPVNSKRGIRPNSGADGDLAPPKILCRRMGDALAVRAHILWPVDILRAARVLILRQELSS